LASAGASTSLPTAVMTPSRITTVPRSMTCPGERTMRAPTMAWTRGVAALEVDGLLTSVATRVARTVISAVREDLFGQVGGRVGSGEHGLRRFLDVWDGFAASDVPMREARGGESYASRETLVTHVVGAARNYLTWIGECVGRPVTDVDGERDPAKVAPKARPF